MVADRFAIQNAACFAAIIESDNGNMHIGAVQNPIAVTFGKENSAALFDALQNFPIGAAANGLRGNQTGALHFAVLQFAARAFSNQ